MDSERLICSSSTRLPNESYPDALRWSKQIHHSQGDCLISDYMSSLSEEPYTDLTQNSLLDLAILDTSFRTMGSDQLRPCSYHKTIRGKAIHSTHCRLSFTETRVWPTRTSSVAQSDVANLERTRQNEIGSDSRRLHSRICCVEKAED